MTPTPTPLWPTPTPWAWLDSSATPALDTSSFTQISITTAENLVNGWNALNRWHVLDTFMFFVIVAVIVGALFIIVNAVKEL